MAIRQGTLLENDVKRLFDALGFRTQKNIRIKGYEIDVLANNKNYRIAIECKQSEKTIRNIRNLIFEWAGKNSEIGVNKIILVIYNVVSPQHKTLAKKNGIIIWDYYDFERRMDMIINDKQKGLELISKELDTTLQNADKSKEFNIYEEERFKTLENALNKLMEKESGKFMVVWGRPGNPKYLDPYIVFNRFHDKLEISFRVYIGRLDGMAIVYSAYEGRIERLNGIIKENNLNLVSPKIRDKRLNEGAVSVDINNTELIIKIVDSYFLDVMKCPDNYYIQTEWYKQV